MQKTQFNFDTQKWICTNSNLLNVSRDRSFTLGSQGRVWLLFSFLFFNLILTKIKYNLIKKSKNSRTCAPTIYYIEMFSRRTVRVSSLFAILGGIIFTRNVLWILKPFLVCSFMLYLFKDYVIMHSCTFSRPEDYTILDVPVTEEEKMVGFLKSFMTIECAIQLDYKGFVIKN